MVEPRPILSLTHLLLGMFEHSSPKRQLTRYSISRYPQKITKRMGAKRVHRRSRVKPFIKVINYNHLMPTRYTLELEGLKGVVAQDTFKEPEARKEANKTVKKVFEERFQAGKNRWFFQPLRF
jgi:large subunit ribosomal protein L27e